MFTPLYRKLFHCLLVGLNILFYLGKIIIIFVGCRKVFLLSANSVTCVPVLDGFRLVLGIVFNNDVNIETSVMLHHAEVYIVNGVDDLWSIVTNDDSVPTATWSAVEPGGLLW